MLPVIYGPGFGFRRWYSARYAQKRIGSACRLCGFGTIGVMFRILKVSKSGYFKWLHRKPSNWVIFERAERLGVPVYIHPRMPSPDTVNPYLPYPALATAMSGFSAEVSLHALRLILTGLFDRYPEVKIILGHLGEALPFWLWRLDNRWFRMPQGMHIKKKPSQYIKDNFFITTAGNFSVPAFLCPYLELGADRILFAVDYPLESNKEAVEFMEALPISDSDKEKVCHLNAERLFKL